jgi:hypothetical protein
VVRTAGARRPGRVGAGDADEDARIVIGSGTPLPPYPEADTRGRGWQTSRVGSLFWLAGRAGELVVAEFIQLGLDDGAAVALAGILPEVILVVGLG